MKTIITLAFTLLVATGSVLPGAPAPVEPILAGPGPARLRAPRLSEAPPGRVPQLHWAALAGDAQRVVHLLNQSGTDPRETETLWGGETALHWAAYGGNPLVVRYLVAYGVPVDGRDNQGQTALMEAVNAADPEARALVALLAAGADPDLRSDSGWTPLHSVMFRRDDRTKAIVDTLRYFGADPDPRHAGTLRSPLHLAAMQPWDRYAGQSLLLRDYFPNPKGADPNAPDANGSTPLHWLVSAFGSAQDSRVAASLIWSGADPTIEENNGYTAIDLARAYGLDALADSMQALFDQVRQAE